MIKLSTSHRLTPPMHMLHKFDEEFDFILSCYQYLIDNFMDNKILSNNPYGQNNTFANIIVMFGDICTKKDEKSNFVINQWNVHPETRYRLVAARFYVDLSWYPRNLLSNLVKLR